MDARDTRSSNFGLALALVLLFGLALRLFYLSAQPASDPWSTRPMLDGAYYLEWARGLANDGPTPAGAFYLAPLYPYALSLVLGVAGENFWLIYLLQHLLTLVAAAALALVARRLGGDVAALLTAGFYVLYHPLLYFASRPLGETLALTLLALAVLTVFRAGTGPAAGAGALAAAAALARPNLLLLPCLWVGGELVARRPRRAVGLALGAALVVAPVTLYNLRASGHFALISTNGGMTAFHGNGPGARGIFTLPLGMTGNVLTQREEATRLARRLIGREVDPVEADRLWGRWAWATRLQDPAGTAGLLARRAALLLDNFEHGLDYHPMEDDNPLRLTLRQPGGPAGGALRRELVLPPFALLLGLAVAGLVLRGWRGTGGFPLWSACAVAAATPLAFYVSSRYRLPLAAMLTVPAGVGLVALGAAWRQHDRRRTVALIAGAVVALVSFVVPSNALRRIESAGAEIKRAQVALERNDLAAGETLLRRAVALDPASPNAHFRLGRVLEMQGDGTGAEAAYREALARGAQPDAAAHLARRLGDRGEGQEGEQFLRAALKTHPYHKGCWVQLVIVTWQWRGLDAARGEAASAEAMGVELPDDLIEALRTGTIETDSAAGSAGQGGGER